MQAWWQSITKAERVLLAPRLATLKSIAKAADVAPLAVMPPVDSFVAEMDAAEVAQ